MDKQKALQAAYINFQKIMFTIGLHKEEKDSAFLALLTAKDKEDAVLFASYLRDHEEETSTLQDLSWQNVLHKIKGEPLEEGSVLLSGLFKTYVEHLVS